MTIAIDKDGNIVELYDLPASSGGGGGGGDYTAKNPISINNGVIGLKIDNQTLQLNTDGQLAANLDELGNEVNAIAGDVTALQTEISTKQDELVSGSNIKTINNQSLLGSGNITIEGGGTVDEQYGIKGDYATQYGILENPNGILEINGMNATLKQGVVMQCAGQDIKTTVANDMPFTITATNDIDLFYAGGSILECGEVFYQESEPDNGTANYIAWWQPSKGKWQFKSNETGNVFREAIACRLAHIHTDGTTITRVDYIGNRILDDEIFAEKKDLATKQDLLVSGTNIKTINNTSLLGEGNISISGSGTLTPEIYMLNDTVAGNVNLDTVEVASSSAGLQTITVATLPVTAGWYIVTYKGLMSFTASDAGIKVTVLMQTYNSTTDKGINQAYSGFVGASGSNTYYVATAVMKVSEGEALRIGMQQYASGLRENHTRGFIAMRIGDI